MTNENQVLLTQRREAIRERSRDAGSDMPIARYCEVMVRELAAYVGDHRRDIVRQRLSPEFAAEVQLIVDDIGRDFAYRLAAAEHGGEVVEPNAETSLMANFYAAGLMGAVRWWFNECPDQDEAMLIEALDEVSGRLFGISS